MNYKHKVSECGDIRQRVAVSRNEIRHHPRLDGTYSFLNLEAFGGYRSCGFERLHGRHTAQNQFGNFIRDAMTVGVVSIVGSRGNLYAHLPSVSNGGSNAFLRTLTAIWLANAGITRTGSPGMRLEPSQR